MTEPQTDLEDQDFTHAEFLGDITDYWSYTQVRDWVLHMSGLTPTAALLYLMLRSMITEKRPGGLRRMSIDQLCYLVTPFDGKPVGESTVRNSLTLLARLGLVTNPDRERIVKSTGRGGIQNTMRRYQVRDLPDDVFQGWRNTWDKLDAYRTDWREHPVEPPVHHRTATGVCSKSSARNNQARPGQQPEAPVQFGLSISSTDSSNSSAPVSISSRPVSESSSREPVTSINAAPKEGSRRSSSLPAPEAGQATLPGVDEARETKAAPPTTTQAPPALSASDQLLAVWKAARLAAGHGQPYGGRAEEDFRTSVTALLQAGEPLPWLLGLAEWMGSARPAWSSLAGASTAQAYGAPPRPATLLPQQLTLTKCPECDPNAPLPTHYQDPENGLGPFRCPSSMAAAV